MSSSLQVNASLTSVREIFRRHQGASNGLSVEASPSAALRRGGLFYDRAVVTSRSELADAIRADLRTAADPALSPGMQSYMKSAMPYLGVRVPQVRRLAQQRGRAADAGALRAAAEQLWRTATHREDRYAAQALLALPALRAQLDLLPLHQEIVVTGAWWDHVDEAAHRIGELLRAHPADLAPIIRDWARSPDRWLRRVAVLSQLDARGATDIALLTEVVDANAADQDFFLRKGIGWALRQYARTDPEWVRAFLAARGTALSPLTRREAAKHLH